MPQWGKVIAIRDGNLSLVARVYIVEGENWHPQSVMDFHMRSIAYVHTPSHTHNKINEKVFGNGKHIEKEIQGSSSFHDSLKIVWANYK